jgi:hypothetical protein
MADRHVRLLKSSALARARKLIDVKAHIAKRADHITLKLKLITAAAALPAGVSAEMISTAMQVQHPTAASYMLRCSAAADALPVLHTVRSTTATRAEASGVAAALGLVQTDCSATWVNHRRAVVPAEYTARVSGAQVAQGASEWSASAPDGTTVHEFEALVAEMDSHAGACAGAPMRRSTVTYCSVTAGDGARSMLRSDSQSVRRCDRLRIRFDRLDASVGQRPTDESDSMRWDIPA